MLTSVPSTIEFRQHCNRRLDFGMTIILVWQFSLITNGVLARGRGHFGKDRGYPMAAATLLLNEGGISVGWVLGSGELLTYYHSLQYRATDTSYQNSSLYYCVEVVLPSLVVTVWVNEIIGKLTLQCLGFQMINSSSLSQDPTDKKMGTGLMPSTSTFLRFFHLGRWEATTSPASACEEVGHPNT